MSREDQVNNRKRCILYLIEKYLMDMGLELSATALRSEASLQIHYEICDNIDLDTIYLEYYSFYNLKFNRNPKILKYVDKNVRTIDKSSLVVHKSYLKKYGESNKDGFNHIFDNNQQLNNLQVLRFPKESTKSIGFKFNLQEQFLFSSEHTFSSEWREYAKIICRDLINHDLNLKWENICGNKEVVELLKEAIVLPLEHPEYFSGVLRPWKAILLYGPPGTGKTLLAKTLCSETYKKVSFFHVRSSTIISKWRGESEKIIRVLFDMANRCAPSIIFFDEIDGIISRRDSLNEHEASKRFKNELLSLLDSTEEGTKNIFILANTNIPWDIDAAFLRRFERKVLVSLPEVKERRELIKYLLPNSKKLTHKMLSDLAIKCEGFTGDEIRVACKEAAMKQMRYLYQRKAKGHCPDTEITEVDLSQSFDQIQPMGQKLMSKYIEWSTEFGNKLSK